MEKTGWFPATMKPIREGAYETRLFVGETLTFQYWNGEFWSWSEESARKAAEVVDYFEAGHFQEVEWRGMREPS